MKFHRWTSLICTLYLLACSTSPGATAASGGQAQGPGGPAGQGAGPVAVSGSPAASTPAAVGGSEAVGAAGRSVGGSGAGAGAVAGAAGASGAAGATGASGASGTAGAAGSPNAGAPVAGGSGSAGGSGAAGAGGMGAEVTEPMPTAQSCSASPTLRPGATSASLMFGGAGRMYRMYVPAAYKPDAPVPLVLWFHGILGSSQDYRTSGFQEVADREGFVLVAPEGTDTAWNIGPCCTARSRNVDDVGFAKALVAEIKGKACIDARRVYAAGFSMGGGMSHYLACHAADVFAAVAPSAFDLLQENVGECKPVRPISVMSFRNKGDNFVYYDGVPDSTPPNTLITGDTTLRINILGAQKTLMEWGRIDGCTGAPEADGAGCETYKTCSDGVEVTLCTEDDRIAGHHPGPADQMWERLKRFQLP